MDPHCQVVAKILPAVPLLLGQMGCGGEKPPGETLVLRDSAGVAIFEAPADSDEVRIWRVGETPELLLGGEGMDDEPLSRVRAGGLFADGSFMIANQGSHQLRFYFSDGVFERALGREGGGPEEFGWIDFLQVIADTVWVYDRRNLRISLWDRAGEFVREIPLGAVSTARVAHARGVFSDGSILLLGMEPTATQDPGLRRYHELAYVMETDGSVSDLEGRFVNTESYWQSFRGRPTDAGLPFGRQGFTAVRGSAWYHTAGEEYRVERYDQDGRLRGVYSYPAEPQAVSEGDREEYLEEFRAMVGGPTDKEKLLRKTPLPERMPAYAGLTIDAEGNVWAALYAGPRPPRCWHVYQVQPPLFAEICLPERFTVLDIADGSVLGVVTDEYDVERVAWYRLVK